MIEEHPLIADLIAQHESGALLNDREPHQRRLVHSCGHKANSTVYGGYRLEDRFAFSEGNKCGVCMAYDSWRHTGCLPVKPNAVIKKSKWFLFEVMMNFIESDDIQGADNG